MTIAEPRRASASPGSRKPVALCTWSATEDVDGGETGGQPTGFGEHWSDDLEPNSPDNALHAMLTILPGEAIAAAPMVASGRSVSMSLESPPVEAGEESIDCAVTSAYVFVACTPSTNRPLTWVSAWPPKNPRGSVSKGFAPPAA